MGLFDKMFKRQEAPKAAKPERKLPPAMPGQREALVKNEKGMIMALRADMQYVKVTEAFKYIADQRKMLNEQFRDLRSLPEDANVKKRMKGIEDQMSKLAKFEEQANKRSKLSAESGAAYAGQEPVVENPFFQEKPEELGAEDIVEVDEREAGLAKLEEQKKELAGLREKQMVLSKKRDLFLQQLKSLSAEADVGEFYKRLEESKIPEAEFPHYFAEKTSEDLAKTTAAELEASRQDIKISEARGKKSELAKPLKELLDELDETSERIAALERNVKFGEQKWGAAEKREAA